MRIEKGINDFPVYHWWSWWSNWSDVCMFEFGGQAYLLQARRSRLNKVVFRTADIGEDTVATCRLAFLPQK